MACFVILPPRAVLVDQILAPIQGYFPGVDWPVPSRESILESVIAAIPEDPHRIFVFRDELPAGLPVEVALRDGFGAEPEDEVMILFPERDRHRYSLRANLIAAA